MTARGREIEMLNASRDQLERWSSRRRVANTVDGLAGDVVEAGDIVERQSDDGLSVLLLDGTHQGMSPSGENCSVMSVSNAVINEPVVVSGSAVFVGVTFSSVGKGGDDALVVVKAGARLQLVGCTFVKEPQQSPTFISVASGGKVVILGGRFCPKMNLSGNVIENVGINGDVGVVGVNETGNALGAVTPVFVT